MFPSNVVLCLLTIALSTVDGSPVRRQNNKATLTLAKKINERGILNIVEMDRARAQAMKLIDLSGIFGDSFDITNNAVHYTANVTVGVPPTTYKLIIDTGSANTFVGTGKPYVQTATSKDTGNTVSVSYGSGKWSGEEWIDTVTLSPELVIDRQSIGVASSSSGFDGVDGILGVGPVGLTNDTVANTKFVPTVSDNLYEQGTIWEEVLGVYFVPMSDSNTGKLTFGGYDDSVITSSVDYVPLTTTSPASNYWGIDQSVTYDGQTVLSSTAGIVDTGTTLVLLATDAFEKYQSLTGGVMDEATSLLSITSDQYANLKPLIFNVGDNSYSLSPDGQIWPRSLNTLIGGSSEGIYLIVSDIGSNSGSGLDFMNGYTFLERFYSVYDTTNGRVGFATTEYTDSTSNFATTPNTDSTSN